MSAERVEYHQGAIADVKSAVAWYQKRSPKAALDFIEELHRAAETIREAPERWPPGKNDTRRFPALAIPVCHHLFRARIRRHNLGRCPRQQTTGVLGTSALNQKEPPPTMVTFQSVA
jgi:plasmid stabilization system protein ParE